MYHHLINPGSFAILLIRLFTGILFFFQGYDKIFKMGLKEVERTIVPSYKKTGMPTAFIAFVLMITSWIELLGGLMLIIGLFRFVALYLLGFDLVIVAVGMSLLNPMWDLQFVFPRLLLIVLLLLIPFTDFVSFDYLLAK